MDCSSSSWNQSFTNVNETNILYNLQMRKEIVGGDNPQLTIMKEAIECSTNIVNRLKQDQATTFSLVDIEMESPTRERTG